ncbi:PAS domain S-box protein [Rufibacter psychrotolerans]|uniref:PAS domain S-box protein n=1 Tax=Rufibacter psychrotolerans TaxID=2812556 RepID=UPI00293D6F8D|nr:PAS domain S-box protein [Rufibacter sp. SYSU D00308]
MLGEELALLRSMIEHSMEPMLLTYVEGKVILVNQAMCGLVGKDRATLLREGRAGIMDLSDPRLQVCLETRRKTGHFKGELLCRHANGSSFPVMLSTSAFRAPSGKMVASVHIRDLRTEQAAKLELGQQRAAMEMALRELQMVMDNTLDVICLISSEGKITQINAAGAKMWGYPQAELMGRYILELVHPEDRERTRQAGRQVLTGAHYHNYRNRYLHQDGSVVYMDWSTVFSEEKKVMYCIGRNISNLVQAEQIKARAEEQLQALLRASSDAIIILKEDGSYAFIGPSVQSVMGMPSHQVLERNAFDFVHPEDKAALWASFQRALQEDTVVTQPYRFPTADSSGWRWFEAIFTNRLTDPDIQGIVVATRDVTERYLAQVELQKSEQRYRSLFDYNPGIAYSLDTQGLFTSLNKNAIEMVGLPQEQILGRHFNAFAHPAAKEHNELCFRRVLAGEPVTTQTTLLSPDHQERHYTFTEIPIKVNGEVVGVHGLAHETTENKRQQKLLEATAQRLNTILESIRDAFFAIDHSGRFTFVNSKYEAIMQVSREELIGRSLQDVFVAQDVAVIQEKCRQALATQEPVHYEQFSAQVGEWLDMSVYPSDEGFSVFFKEITTRKQAEEELEKLSWVASKTVNSVYITDEFARIEWVNDGFTRLSGYTLEEIKGLRPGDLLAGPETGPEKVAEIRRKLQLDLPFTQEVQNRNKNGDLYWSKLDVTPILEEGSRQGKKFIVIETDITEQKKAEQERQQLTEELVRRNRHLEQFTYIVSHNLRSPVANILGLTDLMSAGKNPELLASIAPKLRQTAQNLDQIIRDLNEMLSLQTGILQETERVFLPEVVEQALQVLPANSYEVATVELNGVEEIGSIRSYVSSILNNLLTNAVKYKSPHRPLHLSITVQLHPEANLVCLSVTDNGLGINLEKERKNLFGLYKRFHFHVSGRGLGLYLVKTQAEALGGYVEVTSTLNEGSTFRVWIRNS